MDVSKFLATETEYTKLREAISAESADTDRAIVLGIELLAARGTDSDRGDADLAWGTFEEVIAEHAGTAAILKGLARTPHWNSVSNEGLRRLSSVIVTIKSSDALGDLISDSCVDDLNELFLMIAHEATVLGRGDRALPTAVRRLNELLPAHALSRLPACRFDMELKTLPPLRQLPGVFYQPPTRQEIEHSLWDDVVGQGDDTRFDLIEDLTEDPDATAAIGPWRDESNGRYEVKRGKLSRPCSQTELPVALTSLGLKCLENVEANQIRGKSIGYQDAYCLLFDAAAGGCAHWNGFMGAWGRYYAWTTLSSVLGLDALDSADL